jgi:serine/threonine-protein kinase RsbW
MVKSFPAALNRLYEMLQFICNQAADAGFTPSQLSQIELALEEALVNIISYGYPNRRGVIEIDCTKYLASGFKVVLRDSGIPYNPLDPKLMESSATAGLPIGGYGLLLIRKIMDEADYRHEGNCNILTLVKYQNTS